MVTTLAADVLESPVQGRNLVGPRLRDQWGAGRALLVFLRHFG
jgi:hypothetical protein